MKMLKGDRKYRETYDGGIAFYKYGVELYLIHVCCA